MADYDLTELRRRIAVSFSTAELSQFAQGIHVHLDREGRVDDSARALIRAMQQRERIDDLVDRLRAHKPDVEWPEPRPPVSPAPSPPPDPPDPPPQTGDPPIDEPPPAASAADPPTAPSTEPPGEDKGPTAGDDAGGKAASPVIIPSMLGAALAGGVAVGIAATWLALRKPKEADPPAPIAKLAAEQLEESVAGVVRACGGDDEGGSARDRLRRSFDRCVPQPSPGSVEPDPLQTSGARASGPPLNLGPSPSLPGSDSCLINCNAAHEACRSNRCGPEPSGAAPFANWQRCQSACLADNSRCRLACR
jgi:hypothetical protein